MKILKIHTKILICVFVLAFAQDCSGIPYSSASSNSAAGTLLTFKASRYVTPEIAQVPGLELDNNHLVEYLQEWKETPATFMLGSDFTSMQKTAVGLGSSGGFSHSVFEAYKNHHNLIIRPDDIWTAILVQFSFYVNAHAEKLRTEFVNFEEKENLVIGYGPSLPSNFPEDFVRRIIEKMDDHIQPDLKDWIMPNFTTTTQDDLVTVGAIFMSTLQHYFNYIGTFACGIPEITLEGTVEDWKDIKERVGRFPKYSVKGEEEHLETWTRLLQSILDKFIALKETHIVDHVFWESIAQFHLEGGFQCGPRPTLLNGWLSVFNVFDKEGKWQVNFPQNHQHSRLETEVEQSPPIVCWPHGNNQSFEVENSGPWPILNINRLSPGVVHVPIILSGLGGRDYDATVLAGHVGYAIMGDKTTLKPLTGWGFAILGGVPSDLLDFARHYLKPWASKVSVTVVDDATLGFKSKSSFPCRCHNTYIGWGIIITLMINFIRGF